MNAVPVEADVLNAAAQLVARQSEYEAAAFAEGFRLGYATGDDVGYGRAEREAEEGWAEAWAELRAEDRPDARVHAAERYCRSQAERQWSNPRAWESAAESGRVPVEWLRRSA